jgi:two-component system, NtrC family, response regulator HydG
MKKSSTGSPGDLSQPLLRTDNADIDKVRFPDLADLMARLRFSTSDGRILMDDQRMLLIHAKALGSLRREMIETLGMDVTRRLFTRMGYQAPTTRRWRARCGPRRR